MNQEYKNFELILVDDGSNDGSEKICDIYKKRDCRVKVLHQTNKGISEARNVGMKVAKGTFIQFIDSDDYVDKLMLKEMVYGAERYKADMVVCEYYNVFTDGNMRKLYNGKEHKRLLNQAEYTRLSIQDREITDHLWRRLIKRKLIENIIFPEKMNFEDIYVSAEITKNIKKVLVLNNCYYFYNINNQGTVKNISIQNFIDHFRAIKNKYTQIKEIDPQFCVEADKALVTNYVAIYGDLIRDKIKGEKSDKLKEELTIQIKKYPLYYVNGKLNRIFTFIIVKAPLVTTFCYRILHLMKKIVFKIYN